MTVNSIEVTCSSPIAIAECRDVTSPSVNYTCDNYTFDYNCMCRNLIGFGYEIQASYFDPSNPYPGPVLNDEIQASHFDDKGGYVIPTPLYIDYHYCDELDIIANAHFGLSLSSAYLTVFSHEGKTCMSVADDPIDNSPANNDTDIGVSLCQMRRDIQLPEKFERIMYGETIPSDPPEENLLISILRNSGCQRFLVF